MAAPVPSKPSESKKEDYRKYLERSGVVDALTKVLVALYEEPERPANALDFIKQYLGAPTTLDLEAMKVEMEELKKRNEELAVRLEEVTQKSEGALGSVPEDVPEKEKEKEKDPSESGDAVAFLDRVVERVPHMLGVMVADREGVELARSTAPVAHASMTITFAMASEQASKLRLGRNESITSFFDNCVVVQVDHAPLVLTLVSTEEGNVGAMLDVAKDLMCSLESLRLSK